MNREFEEIEEIEDEDGEYLDSPEEPELNVFSDERVKKNNEYLDSPEDVEPELNVFSDEDDKESDGYLKISPNFINIELVSCYHYDIFLKNKCIGGLYDLAYDPEEKAYDEKIKKYDPEKKRNIVDKLNSILTTNIENNRSKSKSKEYDKEKNKWVYQDYYNNENKIMFYKKSKDGDTSTPFGVYGFRIYESESEKPEFSSSIFMCNDNGEMIIYKRKYVKIGKLSDGNIYIFDYDRMVGTQKNNATSIFKMTDSFYEKNITERRKKIEEEIKKENIEIEEENRKKEEEIRKKEEEIRKKEEEDKKKREEDKKKIKREKKEEREAISKRNVEALKNFFKPNRKKGEEMLERIAEKNKIIEEEAAEAEINNKGKEFEVIDGGKRIKRKTIKRKTIRRKTIRRKTIKRIKHIKRKTHKRIKRKTHRRRH